MKPPRIMLMKWPASSGSGPFVTTYTNTYMLNRLDFYSMFHNMHGNTAGLSNCFRLVKHSLSVDGYQT